MEMRVKLNYSFCKANYYATRLLQDFEQDIVAP